MPPLLLLFDVDGTLVAGATEAHRDALHEALWAVHGLDKEALSHPLVKPAGRTDGEIARLILLGAGVSAERIDDRADEVRGYASRAYARLCPDDLSEHVIDGVPELLAWLRTREHVTLGLVTGNYEPIARLKLARAGLGRPFENAPGGFGSDAEDRAALPAIARRHAGSRGAPFHREGTIVIGDTPRDIACARADGLRCIAIATGPYPTTELGHADAVVANAAELQTALSELRES